MSSFISKIQSILSYEGCVNFRFQGDGIGKIGTTGFILGVVGGMHLAFLLLSGFIFSMETRSSRSSILLCTLVHWSLYVTCLCTFHFLEFFTTAVCQPLIVSYQSYIVNHSEAYTMAALASWIEFWIEYFIFGRLKFQYSFIAVGLSLMIAGQSVRSLAMWTCGRHFSHIIMETKTEQHALVTTGIYSSLRHPAYFGWFYWSIGSQILLVNPICVVLYAIFSWSFFSKRIPFEEALLTKFYPSVYPGYCRRTIIGIPFITTTAAEEKDD